MAWQDPLSQSIFSLENQAPPPQLLNLQQVQPLPQYSPLPTQDYATPINPTNRGFQSGLVNLKQNWADANNAENFYTQLWNSGKYNAEQNQSLQDKIGLLQFQKDEYANAADRLRNAARNAGIDTNGFGADNTLEEAQQNLLNNDTRAIQGLLNLKTVPEQQHDIYNRAVAMGMGKKNALIVSKNMGDELRQNNANQLIAGFQNYGLNDDGSINSLGMQFISKLAHEDPVAAALFSQGFAVPKDAYGEMNANLRARLNNESQLQNQREHNLYDWQKTLSGYNFAREERLAQQQAQERMAYLNAALKRTGVAQDKMDAELQNLKRLGLSDEQAAELYLAQHYGNALKTLKPDDEILKDEKKFANFVDGNFGLIEYSLKFKNYEQAQTLIDSFRAKLLGDDFKYAETMNSARAKYLLEKLDLYEKVANNELSFEEMQAMTGYKSPSFGRFQEISNDRAAIQKAKEIARQRHNEQQQQEEEFCTIPDWYNDPRGNR